VTRLNYGAKVLAIGVTVKAVLMSLMVTLLAATAFWQSLVLVVVSAAVTGIFAVLVVVVQANAERSLRARLDRLEHRTVATVQQSLEQQTKAIVESVAGQGEP